MKMLWRTRADGTPRYGNGVVPKSAAHRAKRTNGKTPYDKRNTTARRIDDLMRDLLVDLEPTEAALGLARSAALAAVRIERCEEREVKGLEIDDERLVRLMGAHTRALAALGTLRAKGRLVSDQERHPGTARAAFVAHLQKMAAEKSRRAASQGATSEGGKPS
jgi:hypothetical protein